MVQTGQNLPKLTHDLVERMNGQIWCESQPGHGATFAVRLPLAGRGRS